MTAPCKGTVKEVKQVLLDGSVALKIIKHCQEEGSGSELVTGCLVGVVVDTTLTVSLSRETSSRGERVSSERVEAPC